MTNWNDVYFRISAAGLNDPRWHAENFSRQTIGDVLSVLKFLEKHDINKFNISSLSTAKLATVVVGAVAGKKASVTAEDFLPFDTRKMSKQTGISVSSVITLQNLMKTRKMDARVVAMLAEELKAASLRESE